MNLNKLILPKEKYIHGVLIKRLPIGAYLRAIDLMKGFPSELIGSVFPDCSVAQAYERFITAQPDELVAILARAARFLPREFISLMAILLDLEPEFLEEKLTPTQLLEILTEFWRINELSVFTARAKELMGRKR